MGLNSTDMSRIRQPHHTWAGNRLLTINCVPLNIVATAQINQTDFSYPITSLTVDNTSADWLTEGKKGRLVLIGKSPGAYDVSVGVLRANVTSNTVVIDPRYAGMSAWAIDIAEAIENDYYVSIVKFRPPFGMGSIIRKAEFFKSWDTTYTDQGRRPFDLVNLGPHQQADVDPSTGKARFTIDVSRYHWSGQSYSAHTWNVDGQTVVSSDANQLVVDCAPGCWEISYELTNNHGKVTTAYRYLFANDDSTFPAFNAMHDVDVECQQDRQGCTYSVTIKDPLEVDELFPGQLWLMTTAPRWGNPATGIYYAPDDLSDPDAVCTNFVGYVKEGGITSARGVRETEVTLEGPIKMARGVRIEKQIIIEASQPRNWSEVTSLLSNPVGMFYYLSMFHAPYLINGHDFNFEAILLTLRRKIQNLDSDVTLAGQLEQLSRFLSGEGNIGSDVSGATWMYRNPVYLASSTRNGLSTRWGWVVGDKRGEFRKPLAFYPQVGKTYGGAFAYGGSSESLAFRALAPGYVASQAGGEVQMDDTTVTAFGGQTRVNEIVGFHHARLNKKSLAFEFDVNGIIDVADPARLDEWHTFTVPAEYDPLGEGWTNARFQPSAVTRRWSGPGGTRYEITVEADPESFGYPGIALPINAGAGGTWVTSPVPFGFDPYREKIPGNLGIDLNAVGAWNEYLLLARSRNFAQPHTSWERERTGVLHMEPNWHSDFFTVGEGNPLEMLVLTFDEDSGDMVLYSVPDWTADTLTFNEVETFDVGPPSAFFGIAHVLVDPAESDYWIVAWRNRDGVSISRSTDAGSNWSTEKVGDPLVASDENVTNPIGIAVYDERLIVVDSDGTEDMDGDRIQNVFMASTKAGALSKLANPADYSVDPGAVALTSATNAIVGLVKKESPAPANDLEPVTFDTGTYSGSYVDVDGGLNNDGIAGNAFYPAQNNMAYGSTGGGLGLHVYCTVTVDMDAWYTFSDVDFWYGHNNGVTGVSGRRWHYVVEALDVNDVVLASYTSPESTDMGSGTITVTAAQLGIDEEAYVWKVRVTVREDWDSDTGGGTALIFLDDIDIDATLVVWETTRALYTLSPGTGTYTERNSFQLLPFHHFGIAVNGNDRTELSAIVRDEDGGRPYLIESSDSGVTWSRVRQVRGLVGVKRSNDILLLFGYNRLEVSPDAGVTAYGMLGDWAGRVGPVGRIKGVAGIL